LGLPGDVIER
nr:gastrotropin=14 kDa bile acid binding protein [rats, ileal cytosol, Peptide Partial, 10 aa] [Rattus sp.]